MALVDTSHAQKIEECKRYIEMFEDLVKSYKIILISLEQRKVKNERVKYSRRNN